MIPAVIDNCATEIILNNKSLFFGNLRKSQGIDIVTVGSDNNLPTHVEKSEFSIKDEERKIHNGRTPDALYFLSCLVSDLSIGKLSLKF